jgi:hypothetical protein
MIDMLINGLMLTGIMVVGAVTFFFVVVGLIHGVFSASE